MPEIYPIEGGSISVLIRFLTEGAKKIQRDIYQVKASLDTLTKHLEQTARKVDLAARKFYKFPENLSVLTKFLEDAITRTGRKIKYTWSHTVRQGNKVIRTYGHLNKWGKKVTDRVHETTTGYKRFRMELLSVMFFGMQLQRWFGGLYKTMRRISIEGAFNAAQFSIMAATFSSPVWQFYQKAVWGIAEAIMGLPEPIKEALGTGQLLLGWAGDALSKFGALGLGIDGLQTAFTEVLPAMKKVGKYLKDKLAKVWDVVVETAEPVWDWMKTIYNYLKDELAVVWKAIIKFIEDPMGTIAMLKTKFNTWFTALPKSHQILITIGFGVSVALLAGMIGVYLGDAIDQAMPTVKYRLQAAINKYIPEPLRWFIAGLGYGFGVLAGKAKFPLTPEEAAAIRRGIQGYQFGGFVKRTGLAMVHKGEYVVPRQQARNISMGGYSPTIIINTSISSDYDIDQIVNKINERLQLDWKSMVM